MVLPYQLRSVVKVHETDLIVAIDLIDSFVVFVAVSQRRWIRMLSRWSEVERSVNVSRLDLTGCILNLLWSERNARAAAALDILKGLLCVADAIGRLVGMTSAS